MTPRVITRPFARIDGVPVAIGLVDQVLAAKSWFRQETGYELIVYSGIRTYDEQVAIFTTRYTRTPNGRPVYDVRRWQGVLWYRISPVGTVAQPGTSNHETGRSLDLRDSGPDAGVAASFTSARNQLLSANAHRFGLTHTGRGFREPWHFEALAIADPFLGQGKPNRIDPSDPGQSLDAPASIESEEDDMTPEEKKQLADVQKQVALLVDALVTDGAKPEDWSVPHTASWLRRQFTDPNVDAPGGPQKKWGLWHFLGWVGRTLTDLVDHANAVEKHLGISRKPKA